MKAGHQTPQNMTKLDKLKRTEQKVKEPMKMQQKLNKTKENSTKCSTTSMKPKRVQQRHGRIEEELTKHKRLCKESTEWRELHRMHQKAIKTKGNST